MSQKKNGSRPPQHLSMWGVPQQTPARGSMCEARTVCDRTGIADAAQELLQIAVGQWNGATVDRGHQHAAEALSPERLAEATRAELATLAQLQDDGPGEVDLKNKSELVKSIVGRENSPTCRCIYEVAERQLKQKVGRLRDAIHQHFEANPSELPQVIAEIREDLSHVNPAAGNTSSLKMLRQIAHGLERLPENRDRLIPETYRTVHSKLLETGYAALESAWTAAIEQLVFQLHTDELPKIDALLEEYGRRSTLYVQQLKAVLTAGETHRQSIHRQQQAQLCGVSLPLPGPTLEQVLSGMRSTLRCRDTQELAGKLRPIYLERLRSYVAGRYPHLPASASVTMITQDVPATEQHSIWCQTIDEYLGAGHTLYQQLAAYGVRDAAISLFRRAEPTCYFEGRDHERFGMPVTELTIVVLPTAAAPEDESVRAQFVQELKTLARNCRIVDGAAEEREVSVCRISGGWYIGVEHSNQTLLQRYAQASERGHAPHLFGLVPDSKYGESSPGHINLLARIAPHPNGKETDNGKSESAG